MRFRAAAFLSLFALSSLGAQESSSWITVDTGLSRVTRINFDRLRREAPTVLDVWYETVYSQDQKPIISLLDWPPFARRLADSYIDCDRLQEMLVSEVFYKRDGAGAGSHTPPTNQRNWVPAPPGTVMELVARRSCDIAKARGIISMK